MTLRILTEVDAELYYAFRLRMLKEHPEAYGRAYEETLGQSAEVFQQRFAQRSEDNFVLGCLDDARLLSVAGFYRDQGLKLRHRGHIWGVYTASEARRRGCARLVFADILRRVKDLDGLVDITLAVTVGNHAARQFYESAGFRCYATEPRYIQHEAVFYDIDWMILEI